MKLSTMREINPKETTRAYAFELWMKAPMPMVTFFKILDVSRLVKISKKSGMKFNMLESEKMSKNNCISKFQFISALVIKAFFVYCKVVKEKEYSSFLNR